MDVLHLRTMARKSVMEFGRYSEKSVQQLLDKDKTDYLRWVYFNCSMISFNEEILVIIGIPDNYRITKPGKDPDKNHQLNEELGFVLEKQKYLSSMAKDYHKVRKKMGVKKVRILSNAGILQRYNQGHR